MSTEKDTKSFLMFGGYDEELVKEGTNIDWMQTYNDFLWEIHLVKAQLGGTEIEFEKDKESPRSKVFEFDPNQHFIYVDDEDFAWIAGIMNDKFPSTDPICGDAFCSFENPCEKIGKADIDFRVTIANSVRYGSLDVDLTPDEIFVDGELLEEGEPDHCYLAIFNYGKVSSIQKKNKWVFGKIMLQKYYLIFDASIKDEAGTNYM